MSDSYAALRARVEMLHREFPVGSTVADNGKVFKITSHNEPEESWADMDYYWPFNGVRWIKSRWSWSKRELLISDSAVAVDNPEN